jgi:hypothetical protein
MRGLMRWWRGEGRRRGRGIDGERDGIGNVGGRVYIDVMVALLLG